MKKRHDVKTKGKGNMKPIKWSILFYSKRINTDEWKRKKTLKLIKIAFGGKSGRTKTYSHKSTHNKIKLDT